MGQKVQPTGFRLGVYRSWDARWFASGSEYTKLLQEDLAMRQLITSRLRNASVARIETERSANQLTVIIHTAKPGIVIGRSGASVDALRDNLERISGKKVRVTIQEIKTPELDAHLLAENVASQLEKRIAFRRAVKQSVMRSMRAGAKGVRIQVSGRLGGGDMSRREWDRDGRVPLHTLRADVDFGQAEAKTTFGQIGVSAWIYRGDFSEAPPSVPVAEPPPAPLAEVAPALEAGAAESVPEVGHQAPEPAESQPQAEADEAESAAEMVSEGSPVVASGPAPAASKPRPRASRSASKPAATKAAATKAAATKAAAAKPAATKAAATKAAATKAAATKAAAGAKPAAAKPAASRKGTSARPARRRASQEPALEEPSEGA